MQGAAQPDGGTPEIKRKEIRPPVKEKEIELVPRKKRKQREEKNELRRAKKKSSKRKKEVESEDEIDDREELEMLEMTRYQVKKYLKEEREVQDAGS